MANHLRRLATLPEDLSSVAHTHAECLQAPITLDSEGSITFPDLCRNFFYRVV